MIAMLGQSENGRLQDTAAAVANVFGRLDALAQPEEMLQHLEQLPVVLAGVFIAVGLICLLQGFKLYKTVVILIALMTGLTVGFQLGKHVEAQMIVAVCLGVLLAVLAWPMMKYAVAVTGGLAGAFMGANAWVAMADELNRAGYQVSAEPWVGALVGLIVLGLLSFILFEVTVVLFTSLSGSLLAVLGATALLLQVPAFHDAMISQISTKPMILPMLVVVPTVIGLVIQHQRGGMKSGDANTKAAPAAAK